MRKIKRKNSAYMGLKRGEAGFSFVSTLLSLIIMLITLPILAYFLAHTGVAHHEKQITVEQFFSFIQYEKDAAISVTTDPTHIYFQLSDGKTTIIEQYNQSIRRKVDAKGHEIYIRDIDNFGIRAWEHGFTIHLTLLNGDNYEKKFTTK